MSLQSFLPGHSDTVLDQFPVALTTPRGSLVAPHPRPYPQEIENAEPTSVFPGPPGRQSVVGPRPVVAENFGCLLANKESAVVIEFVRIGRTLLCKNLQMLRPSEKSGICYF